MAGNCLWVFLINVLKCARQGAQPGVLGGSPGVLGASCSAAGKPFWVWRRGAGGVYPVRFELLKGQEVTFPPVPYSWAQRVEKYIALV